MKEYPSHNEQIEFERSDYEVLINNTDDIIWSVNKDFNLIACNKAFIQNNAAIGVTFQRDDYLLNPEIYPAELIAMWKAFYEKALKGEIFKEEVYVPALNARAETWLEIGFNPIYTQDIVDGIACYSRDITERKLAERLTSEIEAKYQSFFETSMDGILLSDDIGNIFTANPAACEIFLMTEKEICKAGRAGIMDLSDQRSELFIQQRKLTGKAKGELVLIRKDGTRFFSDVTSSVYTDINGQKKASIIIRDITERKKADESNKLQAELLHAVGQAVIATDMNGNVSFWNRSAEEIYGWTAKEAINKNIVDLIPAIQGKEQALEIMHELSHGRSWSGEFMVRRKDASTFLAFVTDSPVYNENHELSGIIGISSDISERKKTEDKIKESELRYRSLIEQATDAICIADMFMKIIDINPSGCQLLGYSKEEFLQLSIPDLFIPEELKANPFKMDELKAGKAVRNERRLIRKDGTIVEVEFNAKLLDDGRFTLFARDITERRRGEKLLKENELRYRSLIDQATDAICIADRSLEFIDINPYACEFLGYTKEEALKLFVSDIIFPEDLATNPINKFETIKPNEIIRNERRLKRKDGSAVIMEVSTRLMEDGRLMIFGHDVSARKRAEEIILRSEASLNLLNKELELKNTELEHFAYIVSHDLQEPLRTTSSFGNLLQKQYKGKLDAKADKYLHFITDSTQRMKILITDLLDYSRIGNKKKLQQVDCNAVLNELIQDLGSTLEETGAEINVESLPVITGFKTEVKQLFQNLIVNAIKFRKKDTIPQISISAKKDKNNWTFSIQDNGIGMAEEHTDRIFVIFQRLHTRTEYEGSGIGLAHCKKIVGLHGGEIWVLSKPGEGAIFCFTIPLN